LAVDEWEAVGCQAFFKLPPVIKEPPFLFFVITIAICLLVALAAIYLLVNFRTTFKWIRIEWLRQNIVTWLIVCGFFIAIVPMNQVALARLINKGPWNAIKNEGISAAVNVIFVFNIVTWVGRRRMIQKMQFAQQRIIILLTLIVTVVLFNLPLFYIANNYQTKDLEFAVLWTVYMATVTGIVYVMMSYIELARKRKMQEKELELLRMSELKTKAELDALHSKVNPHFLYNALNSIADLSITDGKKARKMTIALADLFRYSINYAQNNFSTINDEVMMTEVYLQIEKIRFEDQLNYSVSVEEGMGHYLVPRFILQPLVENAVKHGLKVTGKMTEIFLEVKKNEKGLVLNITDNGPAFPDELVPGYGVKSVFDKLDLLFPDQYEVCFSNQPRKQVSVHIHKLIKNEPVV
jgi:two-component system LytT family sensor kinase